MWISRPFCNYFILDTVDIWRFIGGTLVYAVQNTFKHKIQLTKYDTSKIDT